MPVVGQRYFDRQGRVLTVARVEDENLIRRGGYRVLLVLEGGNPDGEWWYDVELDAVYEDGGMIVEGTAGRATPPYPAAPQPDRRLI
jgi:hypothetical protein